MASQSWKCVMAYCMTSQTSRSWAYKFQDSSYHQRRSKYSLLLAHKTPSSGWTHFANTRGAYADLPQARKDFLEDLIIEHEYASIHVFKLLLMLTAFGIRARSALPKFMGILFHMNFSPNHQPIIVWFKWLQMAGSRYIWPRMRNEFLGGPWRRARSWFGNWSIIAPKTR